jgi:hypothetical protein
MKYAAWPAAALLSMIFFCIFFKQSIIALINRIKRIGKNGIEAYESQPAQPIGKSKIDIIEEFYKSFDSSLLTEWEGSLDKFLKSKQFETPEHREKVLMRMLAKTAIDFTFERIFGSIFGSQIACLRFLNARISGASISEIEPIYEEAAKKFPQIYHIRPIDEWIGFLKISGLVEKKDEKFVITIMGREFLKYLADAGKSEIMLG